MALQILEKNGTFQLFGNLNTQTSCSFIIHFKNLIHTLNDVTINIDKIKEIDTCGVEALKTLIAISLKNNSLLSIIGKGCKNIYTSNSKTVAV
jgi:ABC-type transporter Mla MlaB component